MKSFRRAMSARALVVLASLAIAPHAMAQISGQFTDNSTTTVGSVAVFGGLNPAVGYCTTVATDGCSVAFGAVSIPTTIDGVNIAQFADFPGPVKTGNAPYETTRF